MGGLTGGGKGVPTLLLSFREPVLDPMLSGPEVRLTIGLPSVDVCDGLRFCGIFCSVRIP